MTKFLRVLVALAMLGLATAACSDEAEVGKELEVTEEGNTERLGTSTTAAPPETTAATSAPQTTAAPSPTAPPTTAAQPPAITIGINSDTSGKSQFDPRQARVRKNAMVRWTNNDTVPRSVTADNGAFASPMIPPGQSWDYKATASGTFNYTDGTRPYAVGTLQVV